MLAEADACLIIGDLALLAAHDRQLRTLYPSLQVTDLGQAFKELTGEIMVFALWVIRREFADQNPDGVNLVTKLFQASRDYAMSHMSELVDEALQRRHLSREAVEDYFHHIRHHFTEPYRRGLRTYYELAHKIGELDSVPDLQVWEG